MWEKRSGEFDCVNNFCLFFESRCVTCAHTYVNQACCCCLRRYKSCFGRWNDLARCYSRMFYSRWKPRSKLIDVWHTAARLVLVQYSAADNDKNRCWRQVPTWYGAVLSVFTRVLATVILSVSLFVRLSVTTRYRLETMWERDFRFSHYDSLESVVFRDKISCL